MAHVAVDSDALPRDVVYPAGKTNAEVQNEAVAMMDSSRVNATVAALRAAGQPVTEMPMVSSVSLSGPANGQLRPGDLIEAVDGSEVTTNDEVKTAIQTRAVGDPIVFRVLRGGASEEITVTTATERDGPYSRISLSVGYRYAPSVAYRIDPGIVGPSAGLVFALAIYDRITDGVLREGRVVAGTGQVDAAGKVYGIGGIREKDQGSGGRRGEAVPDARQQLRRPGGSAHRPQAGSRGYPQGRDRALQLVNEGQSTQEVPSCG